MNGMPWCTEPFNFDGIHHDRIAVPDTLRVQDTISFLVISELGVIGMLRLQTGQHPVGSSQPSFHHPRRDDIQPLPPRYSEPKQGQRSQSARGFCPRSTMRVPQPDIIEHFVNADAVPQPPERCLSRQAGIVRCCPYIWAHLICFAHKHSLPPAVRYTSAGKHQHRAGHL